MKNSGENSEDLVRQPLPEPPGGNENNVKNNVATMPGRNGGRLNAGGTPGNAGGTGRPTNELRGSMREILAEGLPELQDYATGQKGKPAESRDPIR